MADSLAATVIAAVGDRGFTAYEGLPKPEHERLRAAILELAEAALTAGGADLERWRGAVAEHLQDAGHRLRFYDGVSSHRLDRDLYFETQLGKAEERFRDAGAVHLELGTWTAWPTERTEGLRVQDGLAEVIRLDFEPTYDLDVVADARRLPFRDGSLDRISADSVIEHVPHPHQVLAECFRVLRPGGVLKIITPFAFNLHGYPDDYLRYTPSWYQQMCAEVGFETVVTDVEATRGLYYTLHNSAKSVVVDDQQDGADGLRTLHLLVIELLGALVPLDNGFHGGARHWFTAVQCFAIRGGGYQAPLRERRPDVPFTERCLDLLAVPGTDEPLTLRGDRLAAAYGSPRFPIVDGIPRFTQPLRTRTGGLLRSLKRRF